MAMGQRVGPDVTTGLSYLKKDNIKLECETFDCKSCYANILNSDTLVPIKAGKYITLEALPRIRDLQVGIYKIIITGTHRDARKCFSFAKDHHYTNISLAFAMKHRKQLEFEFEWLEEENNAYVYEHCVPLNSMCGDWFKVVSKLKQVYKENPLAKLLVSGTWGALCAKLSRPYTLEQIKEKKLDVGLTDDHDYIIDKTIYNNDGTETYKLIKCDNAYKFNIGRWKPFITSQARYNLGMIAFEHREHVIRIQTDSLSFVKDTVQLTDHHEHFNKLKYGLEAKTTGLIQWYNLNKYHNLTTGYKTKDLQHET
jgi:hypothetical protein